MNGANTLPKSIDQRTLALIEEGFSALGTGDHESANAAADALLAIDSAQVDAMYLRGLVSKARDDLVAAEDWFERAILAKKDFPDPYVGLLEVLQKTGRRSDFGAVLDLARQNLPVRYETVLQLARLRLKDDPDGTLQELEALRGSSPADPSQALALQALRTRALVAVSRAQEVLAETREQLAAGYGAPETLLSLSVNLLLVDRPQEARRVLEEAVSRFPENRVFRYNLCHALHRAGDDEACERELERLLEEAEDAETQFLRAYRLLSQGRFREGFALYEARTRLPSIDVVKSSPIPAWDGDELEGRRLLVLDEQGYGDNLMFVRFVPRLLEKGADVTYLCPQALYSLLAWQPSMRRVRIQTRLVHIPWSEGDVYTSIMSLPHLLGVGDPVAGMSFPYLAPPRTLVEEWRARLAANSGLTVGIVWAANPRQALGRERSIPPEGLERLLGIPNVKFVSLQVSPDSLNPPLSGVEDVGPSLQDFADTFAVVSCCDLVITVDTSVAHVAGALGKPVWVMTPFVTDWRFSVDGAGRSRWYPSARVFRQPAPGDWASVVSRIADELAFAAAR